MKVKMKSTRYGSADGVHVDEYKKGETYDVRDTLASIYLKEGWAVKVDKMQTKDAGAAPENKSVKRKEKRKSRRGNHGA